MSSGKEDQIKQVLEEFTGVLQLKLPLQHICQFYDESHLNNLAQEEAKKVLMNFQNNSNLNMQETFGVVNEVFPKFQELIGDWKIKNEENKAQCDLFLQSQVDFLLSDFRTSVFIKLVSAPDVGLADLETFLERRKTVLIDIFDKLSKPGRPQSSVNMKTSLEEMLECVKRETLEKQRLHLEQKAIDKAEKVLEHVKAIIMKKARQLKSELKSDQGKYPRDLLRGKLAEIDNYLSTKGKALNECHPSIYSAVLRITAEVRKCLDEKDYEDMSAEKFADILHEQLLDDFGGDNHVEEDSSEVESISRDESACKISGRVEEGNLRTGREPDEVSSSESEADQCHRNQVQSDFGEEEGIEEETDVAAPIFQSGMEDGDSLEDEKEIEMEKSTKCAGVDLDIRPKNPNDNTVNRRSDRFKESSEPVAVAAMQSRPKRNCVVAGIKRKYCIDTSDSNESSEDEDDYEDSSTSDNSDEEEEVVILTPERFQGTGSSSTKKSGSGSIAKNKSLKKPFKCTKCSERFSQRNALHMHMRCHNRKARYVCSTCKLSFISNRGLHHHKNLKHREKLLFGCSYCDERFNETLKLKAHVMYRHTDIRPFRCPMCGASPTNKYSLALHIEKIHSESRQAAQRLANQVAVDYLVKETKNEAYRDIPEENINSAVVSHVIKKANLKIPQRTIRKTVRVHRKKNLPLPVTVKSALSVLHGSRNGK